MDPFVLWLTVALAGVGAFAAYLVRWALTHLESDIAYSRKTSARGVETAERAATIAELD